MSTSSDVEAKCAGYWRMDESSGATRQDSTANNLDLSDVNTVNAAAGKISNAATFSGTDWLSRAIDPLLVPTTKFGLMFWLSKTNVADGQDIISFSDGDSGKGFAIGATIEAKIQVYFPGADSSTENNSAVLSNGVFAHIAVNYDGSQSASDRVKIYVNGSLAASSHGEEPPATIPEPEGDFRVGANEFNDELVGLIDELAYSATDNFTLGEIAWHYRGGTGSTLGDADLATFVPYPNPRGLIGGEMQMSGGMQ